MTLRPILRSVVPRGLEAGKVYVIGIGDKCNILIIKANECTICPIYFGKELCMFRTDLLSIIRSLYTVYTEMGICHASYVECLLADGNITGTTNTYCCEYSIKTPDD